MLRLMFALKRSSRGLSGAWMWIDVCLDGPPSFPLPPLLWTECRGDIERGLLRVGEGAMVWAEAGGAGKIGLGGGGGGDVPTEESCRGRGGGCDGGAYETAA